MRARVSRTARTSRRGATSRCTARTSPATPYSTRGPRAARPARVRCCGGFASGRRTGARRTTPTPTCSASRGATGPGSSSSTSWRRVTETCKGSHRMRSMPAGPRSGRRLRGAAPARRVWVCPAGAAWGAQAVETTLAAVPGPHPPQHRHRTATRDPDRRHDQATTLDPDRCAGGTLRGRRCARSDSFAPGGLKPQSHRPQDGQPA